MTMLNMQCLLVIAVSKLQVVLVSSLTSCEEQRIRNQKDSVASLLFVSSAWSNSLNLLFLHLYNGIVILRRVAVRIK